MWVYIVYIYREREGSLRGLPVFDIYIYQKQVDLSKTPLEEGKRIQFPLVGVLHIETPSTSNSRSKMMNYDYFLVKGLQPGPIMVYWVLAMGYTDPKYYLVPIFNTAEKTGEHPPNVR